MSEASVDQVQGTIGRIFTKVIAVEDIGLDDDFFAIGGHSIAAGRVIGLVRRDLGTRVSLFEFFEEPTVRGLARLVLAGRSSSEDGQPAPKS